MNSKRKFRRFLDRINTLVQHYSNLLLERGERQYGFLHLTLEEMLAAQGIVQLLDEDQAAALAIFKRYLLDSGWHETLQLALGFIGVIQRRPKVAGAALQELLTLDLPEEADHPGHQVIFAGEALLDMGTTNVSRPVAARITQALVETMQSAAFPSRTRRDAGNLLGRLGWTPEPEKDDLLLAPAGYEPSGLDAFRPIQTAEVSKTSAVSSVWIGKYPVANRQFARFVEDKGYERQEFWSEEGWGWRIGDYDSKAPDYLQDWLKNRPPEKRDRPNWWADRQWNSPLYPVVGVSWFEAEAYTRWLTARVSEVVKQLDDEGRPEIWQRLAAGELVVRLPVEAEWEAAVGRGEYPWGEDFEANRLNCADSWAGRDLSDSDEWSKWLDSDERGEAGLTAVTTYPRGVSPIGIWDGSGNVWEWMVNPYKPGGDTMALRGGSWYDTQRDVRVSYRTVGRPDGFGYDIGFRLVVAPVF